MNNLIFYYAVTNYHILCCILHKLKYHRDDDAIIGIPNYHKNLETLRTGLLRSKFFKNVLVVYEFDWLKIKNNKNNKIDIDIENICSEFEKNDLCLKNFTELNICGDQNAIGVYLCKNKIKYNFFEDGCGVLSDESRLMNQFKQMNYHRYEILNKLNIPGNNKCVIKRYGDLNCQNDNYFNQLDEHFSVKEELKTIDKKNLKKIIRVFDEKFQFEIEKNTDLLLTWHYVSAGMMSKLEQELYYCIMVDYFKTSENLAIKPHPADSELDYKKIFPNATIISRLLPSELLPYCNHYMFDSLITGYSTSIYGLSEYAHEVIYFNSEYDKSYRKMHKYFVVTKLLEQMNLEHYKINVYNIGGNFKQILNILKKENVHVNFEELDNLSTNLNIIIIDNLDLKKIDIESLCKQSNNVIIFLDEKIILDNNIDYFDIFPLLIKKSFINNKFQSIECSEEYIYIYNSRKIENVFKKLHFRKNLNYTGMLLEIDGLNQKIYSSVLELYQKKLEIDSLKEENSQLKKELNVIKHSKGYKLLVKYWTFINKLKK